MDILIFGGTTEGRILADRLTIAGHKVTVSCATEVGVEQLENIPCRKLCGRLNENEISDLVQNYDLIVDATHPYSVEVTGNIKNACTKTGAQLRRIIRTAGEDPDCIEVRSCAEAADFLRGTEGNILLTTGSKELGRFDHVEPSRIFARVLPTHEAIDACENIKLPHKNIIAVQGPFSKEMNEAMIAQYKIEWLVTRNSGNAGGFQEKIAAAESAGVKIVLVELPENTGISQDELLKEVGRA